jgi:nitrite reductase/ring-hydroxylating ferredoxin subunit/uncharacterized membrane protein
MQSYAHFKRHPIHPALIPFPFAFLVGAVLFDAGSLWMGRAEWAYTGRHLIALGVLSGLIAAVPGLLDFLKRVPPESSGRRRAARHGIVNATALVLFAVAWWLRREAGLTLASLSIEAAGGLALAYSGWLGGTLVSRNLISVDHRHANAGKWTEARFTSGGREPLAVAGSDDLEPGQMKLLVVNGHHIALARTPTGYAAFADGCTHRGGSLADGVCIGDTVQCLWHGSRFDVKTGEVRCGPAKKKIQSYEVRQKDGQVLLLKPPAARGRG